MFSLAQINIDKFDTDRLISNGLSYNKDKHTSPDFVILDRYNDFLWEAKWLKHNSVFAWHIETNSAVKKRVE